MRLINNATLELESFMDLSQVPPYAILSHTWGKGEVTLQDFASPDREAARSLAGFAKIELICSQAMKDELSHSWVDTCCIDKTSSAELSEAINSMYEWYKAAAVCYVFLPDLAPEDPVVVGEEDGLLENLSIDDAQKKQKPSEQFAALRWFKRGWTLQELIAPTTVQFYDAEWKFRGTKATLAPALSIITRVEESVLLGRKSLEDIPIARRMSWAAGRTTTRAEDIAYCLLGIFDVNMPMLYGEGLRAFIRLQEEIMHDSNDLTLFAWRASGSNSKRYRGVLALSPQEFVDSGSIEKSDDSSLEVEFSHTNRGIRFKTKKLESYRGEPTMLLNCRLGDETVGIYLHKHGAGVYARSKPETFALQTDDRWVPVSDQVKAIYISKKLSPALAASIGHAHRHGIHLRKGFKFTAQTSISGVTSDSSDAVKVGFTHPAEQWDPVRSLFITNGGTFAGVFYAGELNFVVALEMGKPWVSFVRTTDPEFQRMSMEGYGGLWNIKGMRDIAKKAILTNCDGWTVEINEGVVDGEPVYCVDMVKEKTPVDIPNIHRWKTTDSPL